MAIVERERTSAEIVMYALYLYFLGLSVRDTARALESFAERSHMGMGALLHTKETNEQRRGDSRNRYS